VSNESFAQVPLDMEDTDAVQKFLRKVVEEIDLITGARAQDPYVSTSELEDSTVSLTTVNTAIATTNETVTALDSRVEDNELTLEDNQPIIDDVQFTVTHRALDTSYNDFDDAVWGTLKAKGQFSALGSAMTNPPFAVTAGTTYIVYVDSALTTGGGVTQRVMMEDTGVDLKVFYRTGDTFASAVANGWTQL